MMMMMTSEEVLRQRIPRTGSDHEWAA